MAHLATHDFITHSLDCSSITGVLLVSFDMSKAFDRIPHDSVINLFHTHNFPLSFIKWCASYFLNRSQCVILENAVSAPAQVTSGVPQGSIIGPYIFNAYVGSLTTARQTTRLIKYADDLLLLIPFSSLSEADQVLKEESENIKEWCNKANLLLNHEKTQLRIVSKKSAKNPFLSWWIRTATNSDPARCFLRQQTQLGNSRQEHRQEGGATYPSSEANEALQ